MLRTLLPPALWTRTQEDPLIEAARERDAWTEAEWSHWRAGRLEALLERAATRVPYYRQQWAERRRRGDRASWSYLENWPVLERATLQAMPQAFVADDRRVERMRHVRTAGTLGTPLDVWLGDEAARERDALATLRARLWYGIDGDERGAVIVEDAGAGEAQRLSLVTTEEGTRIQLLTASRSDRPALGRILDLIATRRLSYLVGRPSVIGELAAEALRRGRREPGIRVVITAGEALTGEQRCLMGEAFLCSVRETYAVAEQVRAASECWAGRLHEWPEVGLSEILDGDSPAAPGTLGDVVCTGLMNPDMPLIRYRVGDCAKQGANAHACRCGCRLPTFARVEARRNEVLLARDGRRVAWPEPMFDGLPIREGQVTQESMGRVRVRYVPMPWFDGELEEVLRTRLRACMGQAVDVVLERVMELPRGTDGAHAWVGRGRMPSPYWNLHQR